MKALRFFFVAAAVALAASCGPKGEAQDASKETKALLPGKAETDSVSYLVGVNFGSFVKNYDFGELNYSEVVKGINDFVAAKGVPTDSAFASQFKIDPNLIDPLFNAFLEKRRNFTMAYNKEKEVAFLEANKAKEGVQVTESGLQYMIIAEGEGVKPGLQDTVVVNYKGALTDGTVFDQTNDGPVSFSLDRVIPGWSEGLGLIGAGGKIKLFVPSELGYGEQRQSVIGPNSTLVFDVDLLEVKPFVAKEEE